MTTCSTVLLVDSHELVRRGIRFVLESRDFHVLGESRCCREDAVPLAARAQPDVIIMDPDTGPEQGASLDLIGDLASAAERSPILILTTRRDAAMCARSMVLGASGVMYKHEPADVLFKALDRLHAGEVWLDRGKTAGVITHLVKRRKDVSSMDARIETLTKREREVIAGICDGLRNKELGERLFISEATVRNHVTSILDKLGLANRFDLVVCAFRHRLVNFE
jgi:two-component system, NarL family, nitrate/nitrite response regulator NarL